MPTSLCEPERVGSTTEPESGDVEGEAVVEKQLLRSMAPSTRRTRKGL